MKNNIQYIDSNVVKFSGFNERLSSVENELERVDNALEQLNELLIGLGHILPEDAIDELEVARNLAAGALVYSSRAKKISQGQKIYRVLKVN